MCRQLMFNMSCWAEYNNGMEKQGNFKYIKSTELLFFLTKIIMVYKWVLWKGWSVYWMKDEQNSCMYCSQFLMLIITIYFLMELFYLHLEQFLVIENHDYNNWEISSLLLRDVDLYEILRSKRCELLEQILLFSTFKGVYDSDRHKRKIIK